MEEKNLAYPCEALACPNDAEQTVTDKRHREWRVCNAHAEYFGAPLEEAPKEVPVEE
jgi:hypothetical protein